MKTKNFFKSTLFALIFVACTATAGFSQTVIQVIETEPFSGIEAGSIFKIELTQGDIYSLEIETEEEHLDNIETRVRNGVLHLVFSGRARNPRATARITTPEIKSIKLTGASSLKALSPIQASGMTLSLSGATSAELSLMADNLKSSISGASGLTISGMVNNHEATVSGASQLRASELETERTKVNTSGASQARVWAKESLEGNASGTSRIAFDHEPQSKRLTSSGMGVINNVTGAVMNANASHFGDTTKIRIGGRDLLIVDDDGTPRTSIRRSRRSFASNWSGFEMGINGYLSPDNSLNLKGDAEYIDLRYNKSVVVNLNLWQQNFPIIKNNLGLVTGVGIGWNNYRFDNQTRIVHDRAGLEFYEDSLLNITKNKFTVTWINIPLLLEMQSSGRRQHERFHLAGGMILGTRIGTHAKYVYDDNGKKRKEKDYKDFNMNPFRFDVTGRVGWGRVNLFATYSLNSLFKEDKGPELYPFSVGIRLINL